MSVPDLALPVSYAMALRARFNALAGEGGECCRLDVSRVPDQPGLLRLVYIAPAPPGGECRSLIAEENVLASLRGMVLEAGRSRTV